MRPLLLLFLALGLLGCDARYTDLRPAPALDGSFADRGLGDAGAPLDGGSPVDAASPTDGGATLDGGTADGGALPATTLVGAFEGRGGYDASGTATLRASGGALELTFSEDFSTAAVPGPVVVVTSRPAIGRALTAADTLVARLDGDSLVGANTFAVGLPAPPDPAYVFIYCEPFGVETARAALEAR